jgi:exodeoxyribonuclease V gamma subunit
VTVAGDGRLRAVDAASQAHGLVIYRASRLEALLPPLQQLMAATPPRHVLTPHTLIAAHPGMRQWLGGALARE